MRHEARAEFLAKYTAERNYSALMEIYERAIEGRGAVLEPQAAAAQVLLGMRVDRDELPARFWAGDELGPRRGVAVRVLRVGQQRDGGV